MEDGNARRRRVAILYPLSSIFACSCGCSNTVMGSPRRMLPERTTSAITPCRLFIIRIHLRAGLPRLIKEQQRAADLDLAANERDEIDALRFNVRAHCTRRDGL